MKIIKRVMALFLSALLLICFASTQVFSSEIQEVGLNISCMDSDVPLEGAEFHLYLVSEMDEFGNLSVTEEFSKYHVNIFGNDDESWRVLASTLEGYVRRDQISPMESAKTNDGGLVSFSDGLVPGLYLVLGESLEQYGRRYVFSPFMVMLSGIGEEENKITVNAKYSYEEIPDHPELTSRKVLKIWKDDGHKSARPKQIVVQLLCDGEVYDTVTLNVQNNWRHIWSELDNSHSWTLVEKELEHYTVEIVQEGITFVVTNTFEADTPKDPVPPDPTLPQTGQLWWPVPMLISAGLLFILIGLIFRRGRDSEK